MSNKTTMWVVIAVIVIVGGLYFATRSPSTDVSTTGSNTTTNTTGSTTVKNTNPNAQGRVVMSVSDAAADMGNISSIELKLSKVELHSTTVGWVTVSSTPKTYSLLDLNKNKQAKLFADINTKVGTYDQARLTMESVRIKTTNGATKVAKLPSTQMTVATMLAVSEGNTSTINFDFLAKESTFITALGEYIFAPVVRTTTESSAHLTIDSNTVVSVSGGVIDDTSTSGMDIDGSVKINFRVDGTQKFQFDNTGKIKIEDLVK